MEGVDIWVYGDIVGPGLILAFQNYVACCLQQVGVLSHYESAHNRGMCNSKIHGAIAKLSYACMSLLFVNVFVELFLWPLAHPAPSGWRRF